MRKFRLLIATLLSLLQLSVPSFADPYVNFFKGMAANPSQLTATAQAAGFKGAQVPVATAHMKALLSDAKTRVYVSKRIQLKLPLGKKGKIKIFHYPKVMGVMSREFNYAALTGMTRLPAKSQLAYWRSLLVVYDKATNENCATMLNKDSKRLDVANAKRRSLTLLSASQLKNHYALFRQGVIAEVYGKGSPKRLSSAQASAIQDALNAQIEASAASHKNKKGIAARWKGRSNRDRDVCDAGLVAAGAVVKLPKSQQANAAVFMLGL